MLFSSFALLPALFMAVAQAKKHDKTKSKALKTCTDPAKAFVVVQNGLDKYKDILKRSKLVTFAVSSDDLAAKSSRFEKIIKKASKVGFALKLTKEESKALNTAAKKSKRVKKAIKRLAEKFEDATEKTLKMVIVKKPRSSLIKAFKKEGIRVIAAKHQVKSKKNVKKVLKKIEEKKTAGIVFFDAAKVKTKKFKSLIKGLGESIVRRSECFASVGEENTDTDVDTKRNAGEETVSEAEEARH